MQTSVFLCLSITLLCVPLVSGQCSSVVKRGSRGDCVKAVQVAVGTSVDGIFGSGTENAVKSFQRQNGLVADGIVGKNTWDAIYASACSATLRHGSQGSCVQVVQRAVGVTTDGIFGANTEQAVKNFQSQNGLSSDGIVGKNMWAAIYGTGTGSGSSSGGSSNGCGCSYQKATGCSDGPTAGARNLASHLKSKYGGRTEIYNCRTVRGGSSYSLHAEGRAVDLYTSISTGTKAFSYLVNIACDVGIQEVIHNRRIWTQGRGTRTYTGTHPHEDHVHIGMNKCGAQNYG